MAHESDLHEHETPPEHLVLPMHGEHYCCETCGMALEITADCHCETETGPRLECCGKPLVRA
jgi:hypothetical protein